MWRIKTKEEFRQEFGKRWRSTLPSKCNFPEEMDFLLGQHLTETFSKSFLLEIKTNRFGTDLSFLRLRKNIESWNISPDMITSDQTLHFIAKDDIQFFNGFTLHFAKGTVFKLILFGFLYCTIELSDKHICGVKTFEFEECIKNNKLVLFKVEK